MKAQIAIEIPFSRWNNELRGILECFDAPNNDCTEISENTKKLKKLAKEIEQLASFDEEN